MGTEFKQQWNNDKQTKQDKKTHRSLSHCVLDAPPTWQLKLCQVFLPENYVKILGYNTHEKITDSA